MERMPASQKSIYYVWGQDLNAAKRSPHLDYFKANDIEVLYFGSIRWLTITCSWA